MKPKAKKASVTEQVYQFKIDLMDVHPVIWRRVQVPDMSLDQFHECIQSAMGWKNSHLHQFTIDDEQYGNPDMLADDFGDGSDSKNSLKFPLSKLLAKRRKGFRFLYEYDFGDSWIHGITYEGMQEADAKAKYPLCVDGARACPPEDCGGPYGYMDLLEILKDKKHPEHKEMREWIGPMKPDEFSAAKTTKAMQ